MLSLNRYLVKEHVGMFKTRGGYDILNPDDGKRVGVARETTPVWAMGLRGVLGKDRAPMRFAISEEDKGPPSVEIRRGISFLRPTLNVYAGGKRVGYLKKKVLSIGGGFNVFDDSGKKIADLQGSWKGGSFRFVTDSGKELGEVTKKWSGLGKELFTSADNYMISIKDEAANKEDTAALMLAAGIAIDVVYNE